MNENVKIFKKAMKIGYDVIFKYNGYEYMLNQGGIMDEKDFGYYLKKYDANDNLIEKYHFNDLAELQKNCIIDGKNIMKVLPDVDYIYDD